MFLLVVVKCKAFATRMKKRIQEKRRLREEAEGKIPSPPPLDQDMNRRGSAGMSR